jgi:hypothetical protein
MQLFFQELEQDAKSVPVRLDGPRTGISLVEEVFEEEVLDELGETWKTLLGAHRRAFRGIWLEP